MKYLLYCAFYVLFIQIYSLNKAEENRNLKCFISFIDDCRELNGILRIRLMEWPYPLMIPDRDSMSYFVKKAYKEGQALIFKLSGNTLLRISSAPKFVESSYLNQFMDSPEIGLKDMEFKAIDSLSINKLFQISFRIQFNKSVQDLDLQSCCEIRSGLIARFLSEIVGIPSYKLFLKGQLIWFEDKMQYNWSNHVLTILPVKSGSHNSLLVFDPFSNQSFLQLDSYMCQLKRNGSRIDEHFLTVNTVFCLNFPSKKGIPDHQFLYSNYLLKQLLIQGHSPIFE